jgi:excinuclease ABC subunit C
VADIEYVEAESDVDALLMEARLIKDVQPKFNERLKDSKTFPYLEVRRGDEFPGVYFTRYADRKASKYYGPFADAQELRRALHLTQRIFKFRTCALDVREDDPKRRYNRPCLLYYIQCCSAPCSAYISRADYLADIKLFCRFMEGKRKPILGELRKKMDQASASLQFERAAVHRDQIKAMEGLGRRGEFGEFPEVSIGPIVDPKDGLMELMERLSLLDMPRTVEGVDIASIAGQECVGALVKFIDGIPFKPGYRRFRIKTVKGIDDYAMIAEVVTRRYTRLMQEDDVLPDIILIDGGLGHLHAAKAALEAVHVKPPMLMAIAKREEVLHVEGRKEPLKLPRTSAALRLLQHVRDEAHRFAQHYHRLLREKRVFHME